MPTRYYVREYVLLSIGGAELINRGEDIVREDLVVDQVHSLPSNVDESHLSIDGNRRRKTMIASFLHAAEYEPLRIYDDAIDLHFIRPSDLSLRRGDGVVGIVAASRLVVEKDDAARRRETRDTPSSSSSLRLLDDLVALRAEEGVEIAIRHPDAERRTAARAELVGESV